MTTIRGDSGHFCMLRVLHLADVVLTDGGLGRLVQLLRAVHCSQALKGSGTTRKGSGK